MNEIQIFLSEQLSLRKKKNPLYSLRAFAKTLEVSPSHLSNILTGRKSLTPKLAHQIFHRLDVDQFLAQDLLQKIVSDGDGNNFKNEPYEILPDDQFKIISDWEHFAILSLAHIKNNKASAKWISDRLGIDNERARIAFERLKKLNYIQVNGGSFFQSTNSLHTTSDIPSTSIRKYHQQNLQLAADKLEEVPVHLREYTSMTVDVDLKKLPRAKKMIQSFKENLSNYLCSGNSSEVYTISIQLFPLTKVRSYDN